MFNYLNFRDIQTDTFSNKFAWNMHAFTAIIPITKQQVSNDL